MAKKQRRKTYTESYKQRAVKLAEQSKHSASHVARELGVSEKTLLGWVRRAGRNRGESVGAAAEAGRAEIERLRSQVARLKTELEIVLKAAAYFAEVSTRECSE